MNSQRGGAGATYLDGFIYAFFGMTNAGTLLESVERIETKTFKKWHLMQFKNETIIARVCFGAFPLNNNEIITFGRNRQGFCQESFLVETSITTLSRVPVDTFKGYPILEAVCISDNTVVA